MTHFSRWAFVSIFLIVAANSAFPADARLSKPITVECRDLRLHSVLKQISAAAGFEIACGRDENDWRVRDIPVVVCAKDFPVGKLLQSIADSTHLSLDAEGRSYRMWRDDKQSKNLAEYKSRMFDAGVAIAKWEWDAASRIKDIPDSAFDVKPTDTSLRQTLQRPATRELSRLLSALGPDVCDRVLSGERIRLRAGETPAPLWAKATEFLKASWTAEPKGGAQKAPTDEDLAKSAVTIEDVSNGAIRRYITITCDGPTPYSPVSISQLVGLAKRAKGEYIPKYPDVPEEARQPAGSDLSSAFWRTKVGIRSIEGPKAPTYADALAVLSDATGFAIVCEDFHSHKMDCHADAAFRADTTPQAVVSCEPAIAWTVDEGGRIITGTDRNWMRVHSSLVPEEMVKSLSTKLDADGIELDDITPLTRLDCLQSAEWIEQSRSLRQLGRLFPVTSKRLWTFYDSLSTQEKALAKSEAGLPLAKLDQKRLSEEFRWRNLRIQPGYFDPSNPRGKSRWKDIPADPAAIARMVMRVRVIEIITNPSQRKTHTYALEFVSPLPDGTTDTVLVGIDTAFPMLSVKRATELSGK